MTKTFGNDNLFFYQKHKPSTKAQLNPRFVLFIAFLLTFLIIGIVLLVKNFGGGVTGGVISGISGKAENFAFMLKAEGKELWQEETKEAIEVLNVDGKKSVTLSSADVAKISYYTNDGSKWIERGSFAGSNGDVAKISIQIVDDSGFVIVSKNDEEIFNDFSKSIKGVKAEYSIIKKGEVVLVATREGIGKVGKEEADLGEFIINLQPQKNGQITDVKYTVTANNTRVDLRYENNHIYAKIKLEGATNSTK